MKVSTHTLFKRVVISSILNRYLFTRMQSVLGRPQARQGKQTVVLDARTRLFVPQEQLSKLIQVSNYLIARFIYRHL
jgi:hypothetical protein